MCGIAAVVDRRGTGFEDEFLGRVLDCVAHRGPDASKLWRAGAVALGHRRLAILDLSDNGVQPMHWEGRYVLTYNGEVYNYRELRRELQAAGLRFSSETDSEVVLAAYAHWGEDCVGRFNGMWALAIYDRQEGTLFCSRDRFGIKPLYYCEGDHGFALASEIQQLLPIIGKAKLNWSVFGDFLVGGFLEHCDDTFFDGIEKVPPGCNLRYDLSSGELRQWRYYELCGADGVEGLPVDEAAESLRELLRDSVRLRLRADVKVGTCLSGGLDSSGVAAMASEAAKEGGGGFCAIHARGEDETSDESEYARELASKQGLDLHVVSPRFEDFQSSIDAVVKSQGEPFGGTSIFMQYFVMKAACELGCKVMLDGQGGDEVFLGYEKYYPSAYLAYGRRNLLRAFRELRASMRNCRGITWKTAARFTAGSLLAGTRERAYRLQNPYLNDGAFRGLQVTRQIAGAYSDHRSLQALEIRCSNLPVLLRYEDRNSMAHSVEARVPYLDYRVVEFALGLDISHKIRDGWAKYILRKALEPMLPEKVVWRKDKFGFNSPHSLWMNRFADTAKAEISESQILAYCCDLPALLDNFSSLDDKLRWRLFNTAAWERLYRVEL